MADQAATDPGPVAVERRGPVAMAHLNRPETQNALVPEVIDRLTELVAEWDADDEIRCIVIAGSQKVFASGADAALAQHGMTDAAADLWPRMAACQTPLIAAVSGFALGAGWELALACDMIVAGDNAEFGLPEIQLGLIPGGGATQHLARTLGKHRAMQLVLTGKRITAQEAFDAGLVNVVAGSRDWFESAAELALVVSARAPIAAQLAKQAIRAAEEQHLATALEEERRLRSAAMATEDHAEGLQALVERRRPEFKGR